jgi:hypothetical protein
MALSPGRYPAGVFRSRSEKIARAHGSRFVDTKRLNGTSTPAGILPGFFVRDRDGRPRSRQPLRLAVPAQWHFNPGRYSAGVFRLRSEKIARSRQPLRFSGRSACSRACRARRARVEHDPGAQGGRRARELPGHVRHNAKRRTRRRERVVHEAVAPRSRKPSPSTRNPILS